MPCLDSEVGGTITRLLPGHADVLRVPDEANLEDLRDMAERLRSLLDALPRAERPVVLIAWAGTTLEDITAELECRGGAPDAER